MHSTEYPRGAAVTAACVAEAAFALQFVTGQPILGLGGVIAVLIPGYLISQATLGPRARWHEALLMTLVAAVIATLLVGILAALTPRGLDPVTIAVFEHIVLAFVLATWLVVARRGSASRRARPAPPRVLRRTDAFVAPFARRMPSLLFVAVGTLLASGGIAVAVTAAEGQPHAGYLELSSAPSADGSAPRVVVTNGTGTTVTCSIELTRPGQVSDRTAIQALQDGETWVGELPRAGPDEAAAWLLVLDCDEPNGELLQRRLLIAPPA